MGYSQGRKGIKMEFEVPVTVTEGIMTAKYNTNYKLFESTVLKL